MVDSNEDYRRSVNVVAIAVILVGGGLVGAGLYSLRAFNMERNATGLLAQAEQAEKEGNKARATAYLREYLGIDPNHKEVLTRLALLAAKSAQSPQEKARAMMVCENVLRKDTTNKEVRREAGRLAVEIRRTADARVHLDPRVLPEVNTDPSLMLLRARNELAGRAFAEAERLYAAVVKKAPEDLSIWVEYLEVCGKLEATKDVAEGTVDQVCGDMLKAHPESARAREIAAQHYLRAGSMAKAEEHLKVAVDKLGSKDEKIRLLAAEIALEQGDSQKAREHLEIAQRANSASPKVRMKLAWLELEAGRKPEAQALLAPLEKAVRKLPTEERLELGQLLASLGEMGRAAEVANTFTAPNEAWARGLATAFIHHQKREWLKAKALLEPLRRGTIPHKGLARQVQMLLADCYRAEGSPDQAATAIRQAQRDGATGRLARLRLAEALAASGKTDEAIAEYNRIVGKDPSLQVPRAWLLLRREAGRPAGARDWQEVDKALAAIPASRGQDVEVMQLRCEVLCAKGELVQARALAAAARDRKPEEVSLWMLLARIARASKDRDGGMAVIDEAEKRVGRKIEWALARAEHYAQSGGPEALEKLRTLASGLDTWQGEDRERLTRLLGAAFAAAGDQATSNKLLSEAARNSTRDLSVRLMLVDAAAEKGDAEEVRKLARDIALTEGPDGPIGLYSQAVEYYLKGTSGHPAALKECRRLLERVATLRPNWYRVPALEAVLDDLEGKKAQALAKFLQAARLGDTSPTRIRRAMQMLFDENRYQEAEALLLQAYPGAEGLGGAVDQGSDSNAARRKALVIARQAVKSGGATFSDYVWLARWAWLAGEREEAEKALKTARAMDRKQPTPWITLILLLSRADPSRAREELAAAERELAQGRSMLALVACHEILGNQKEAERYAAEVVRALPRDPVVLMDIGMFYARQGRSEEAEKLWRTMLELPEGAPPSLARRARQGVAMSQAIRQRTYPAFEEALALINQNLEGGATPEDLRAKAVVLATQPHRRAEAIQLFERLSSNVEDTLPQVLLLRAELYEAEGKWALAHAQLQILAKAKVKEARFLASAARLLLKHGETAEAGAFVTQLREVAGETAESVELWARWLHALGKQAEARELLVRFAAGREERVPDTALILENLGELAAAEAMIRHLAANPARPDGQLLLARFLGRRQKTAEALRLCDRAWGRARDDDVALVTFFVAREGNASEGQLKDIADKYQAALARSPRLTNLLLAFAMVEDMRGNHDRSAELYRKVLAEDKGNVMALNNLSSLLAVQGVDLKQAMIMISQVIKSQGPVSELLDTRGLIHLASKRVDDAIRDFKDSIAQKPEGVKLFHLARAYLSINDRVRAKDAWDKAQQLGLKEDALNKIERVDFRVVGAELAKK